MKVTIKNTKDLSLKFFLSVKIHLMTEFISWFNNIHVPSVFFRKVGNWEHFINFFEGVSANNYFFLLIFIFGVDTVSNSKFYLKRDFLCPDQTIFPDNLNNKPFRNSKTPRRKHYCVNTFLFFNLEAIHYHVCRDPYVHKFWIDLENLYEYTYLQLNTNQCFYRAEANKGKYRWKYFCLFSDLWVTAFEILWAEG